MQTINIKGKEYVTVNERLKEFRNTFKDYSLITEIIELGVDYATIKASIIDDKGIVRATGFAREVVAKSPINKFAFLENCETSAIGRALGNFGIGIDTAVCTADELLMKLSQEDKPKRTEFEKTVTAEKKALHKAVKESGEYTQKPLSTRAKECLDWLNIQTQESFNKASNTKRWSAYDVKDACLASQEPDLVDYGVKLAEKLGTFEPPLEDEIPY